jgi:hypothetical protein
MTQYSFDFAPPPTQEAQEIEKWVEKHNQQVIAAARTPTFPPGSLASALDARETKANAVYMLRGILSQLLRGSAGIGPSPSKGGFVKALRGEIVLKNANQDPAFIVRNLLIRMIPPRH